MLRIIEFKNKIYNKTFQTSTEELDYLMNLYVVITKVNYLLTSQFLFCSNLDGTQGHVCAKQVLYY
jgi:hypothetical protein